MKRILFVCHGNICRSPMAESVFAEKVRACKLEWAYDVDSAAVSSEEIGNPVHPGTQRELARHGLPRSAHRARQLRAEDYTQYDLFIGMDRDNLRRMERIFGGDPQHKTALLMAYTGEAREIEDPWYTERYDVVYDEINAGCEALLNELEQERKTEGKHHG